MKKIGIFYGSSTGNTQSVAEIIGRKLGVEKNNIISVDKAKGAQLLDYDVLLLGSSTWGIGDLQDDWESFISELKKQNLTGKEVGVFGTGDSSSYGDSFCDSIGIIAEAATGAGAKLVGTNVDTSGYSYDASRAEENGSFVGLPIDMDNEDNKTNARVEAWVNQLKSDCGL